MFWAGARAIFQLLGALALVPVFIALLALALLLGLLPIPQLRSMILSAQSMLVGSIGDSLAFVESPVRAALIRSRIRDGLERLQKRCDRTMIVAHSQGAAAVHAALGGIAQGPDHDKNPGGAKSPPASPVPDVLVTFGSGVKQLVSLKVLADGLPEKFNIGMNPAAMAVAANLAMIGLCIYVFVSIQSGSISPLGLFLALGLYVVNTAVFVGLVWGAVRLIDWLADPPKDMKEDSEKPSNESIKKKTFKEAIKTFKKTYGERIQRNKDKIKLWVGVPLGMAAVAVAIAIAEVYDLPLFLVTLLVSVLLFLAGSLSMILSSDLKTAVTSPVRRPPGLTRWVDLYASADPVPNGRTKIEKARTAETMSADMESVCIWNRGSILSDHTTYWDNRDGFVLRIAQACAHTAKSPWEAKLSPANLSPEDWMAWIDLRAAWRVGFLRLAVWINWLFWLCVAFPVLWWRHLAHVPLPFEFPSWIPGWGAMVARTAVLTVLVAMAAWATAALLRWPWGAWVRAEQELVLAHKNPPNTFTMPLICVGMVIMLLMILAWVLARGDEFKAGELLADPGSWFTLLMVMFTWGILLAGIALWRMPAPKSPGETS